MQSAKCKVQKAKRTRQNAQGKTFGVAIQGYVRVAMMKVPDAVCLSSVMVHRPELHDRVYRFGLTVCCSYRSLRADQVTRYFIGQLVRSSTSPAANYAEAQAAESRRDFVHKMRVCLKELRESDVWLRYLADLSEDGVDRSALRAECDELSAIFAASIKTANRKRGDSR
jgi:four helix bundle protein